MRALIRFLPRSRWVTEIIPYHYYAKIYRAEMSGIVFVYDARMTETNCSADSFYEFQKAVHEAGHAVAALLMGMRATPLSVDPHPDEASLDAEFDCDYLPLDSNESRKHFNWHRAVEACTGPTAENSGFGIGLQTAGNDLLHVAKLEQEAQLCEIELSLWRARAWCMALFHSRAESGHHRLARWCSHTTTQSDDVGNCCHFPGERTAMTRLPLANSDQHALVDDDAVDDLSRFRTWYLVVLRGKAYARGFDRLSKKREFLHHAAYFGRILMLYSGRDMLDHINGDGLDNRRANLRMATPQQNIRNRKPRSGTASGLKGVTRNQIRPMEGPNRDSSGRSATFLAPRHIRLARGGGCSICRDCRKTSR